MLKVLSGRSMGPSVRSLVGSLKPMDKEVVAEVWTQSSERSESGWTAMLYETLPPYGQSILWFPSPSMSFLRIDSSSRSISTSNLLCLLSMEAGANG